MVRFLLVASFILLSFYINAQPGDPGGEPPVPITGLEYLIGGGALIAGRYFYKKRKKE